MGKRQKTSPVGLAAIEHYNKQLKWVQECIGIKRVIPIHNQTNYLQSKSIEYFEGIINGVLGAVSAVLVADNCYYGFNYVDNNLMCIYPTSTCAVVDHPNYCPWRVSFIIKD